MSIGEYASGILEWDVSPNNLVIVGDFLEQILRKEDRFWRTALLVEVVALSSSGTIFLEKKGAVS
jgi:hypothetical protein